MRYFQVYWGVEVGKIEDFVDSPSIVGFNIILRQLIPYSSRSNIKNLSRFGLIAIVFFKRLEYQVFLALGQAHADRNPGDFIGQLPQIQFAREIGWR